MTKRLPRTGKPERDVLDEFGEMIGDRIKSGMSKLEAFIAEAKKKDPDPEETGPDGDFLGYLRAFISDRGVAAITPSSRYLVRRTITAMALEDAKVIVEYGAARGVLTRRILQKMRPDAKLVAIEFNRAFYEDFSVKLKDPRMIAVHGDVTRIDAILAEHGIARVDRIVSGVPFSFFSDRGRRELLTKTAAHLNPGGRFIATYQITTHLIPLLKHYFRKVDIQFEMRNMPPCFVFTALK